MFQSFRDQIPCDVLNLPGLVGEFCLFGEIVRGVQDFFVGSSRESHYEFPEYLCTAYYTER